MPPPGRVKISRHNPRIVGVITNSAELRRASGMSAPPDLFELRLDSLVNENALEQKARNLPAPLIITARHPAEGGKHNLPGKTRRDLLLRFLPLAQYVDIELRSVQAFRVDVSEPVQSFPSTISGPRRVWAVCVPKRHRRQGSSRQFSKSLPAPTHRSNWAGYLSLSPLRHQTSRFRQWE
jgi:hypothetical protein